MTARKKVAVVPEKVTLTYSLLLLSCSDCSTTINGRFTDDAESWPQHRCAATRRPERFNRSEPSPARGSLHKYAVD
jgi:hypothetical protein